MTEVNLTSDIIWGWFPLMSGSIARFKLWLCLNVGIAAGEPREVSFGVVDHFFREVGAVNGIAHQGSFLKDDASSAEWIENATVFGACGSEVD